jgi:glycosyltransferase A (GT-A) superfamily protein (DUF2064 family)
VPPGDVGIAMCYAIDLALDHRATQVALIGSDLPSLPPAHIEAAFARLDAGADIVLGPAEDGGYYLIAAIARTPNSSRVSHGARKPSSRRLSRRSRRQG